MTKLPILSSNKIVKVLKKKGFAPAPKRGKGSHFAFVKKAGGKSRLVIIPAKRKFSGEHYFQYLTKLDLQKTNL